jgi:hypothetical protein
MGSNPILAAASGGRWVPGWLDCAAEAWPSGRRHTPGKRVGGQLPRGFEPLSLRHGTGSSICGFPQATVGWSVLGPPQPRHGHVPGQLQALPEGVHLGRKQMPVGVERDARGRMPELRLHRLHAGVLGDEQADASVPQIVETQPFRRRGRALILGQLGDRLVRASWVFTGPHSRRLTSTAASTTGKEDQRPIPPLGGRRRALDLLGVQEVHLLALDIRRLDARGGVAGRPASLNGRAEAWYTAARPPPPWSKGCPSSFAAAAQAAICVVPPGPPAAVHRHATASTDPRVHEDGQTVRPGNRMQHKGTGRPSRRRPDGEPGG